MDKTSDAQRLKQLYDSRVPRGMSQGEFGKVFGIGTQGMVSQYLNGHNPLTVEAAAKFAKGLRCTIADFSPDIARRLKADIFPVLGRVSVKAAIALMMIIPPSLPNKAEAAFNIIKIHSTHWMRWILRRCRVFSPVKTSHGA